MAQFDIATVGDNCIDRYLPPVGVSTVGGNAVNVAVHLARQGHRVAYFGAVGDDADGHRTAEVLARQGVVLDYLRMVPGGQTAYSDIAFQTAGERVMAFEDFGVCADYRLSDAELEILRPLRHVHLGWMNDGGAAKRALIEADVSVSQDLGVNADPQTLDPQGLTVAFASVDSDGPAGTQRLARLLTGGAAVAVVTRGRRGSLASDGHTLARAAASTVDALDTLGAGDTFIAGFLGAYLGGGGLEGCLRAGGAAATETCLHYGGFPQEAAPFRASDAVR